MALFSLRTLAVHNFRCFEHFEVDLDPQMNVLYADNGGGKTSLLRALAVAMGAIFSDLGITRRNIHGDDVRTITRLVQGQPESVEFYPVRIACSGIVRDKPITWARELRRPGGSTTTKELQALTAEIRVLMREITHSSTVNLPLLGFYGIQRLLWQHRDTEGRRPRAAQSRLYGYNDCLNPASNEKQILEWLYHAAMAEFQSGERLPQYEALQRAVLGVLGGDFVEFRYDARLRDPCLVRANGEILPWSRFSDGYHTFVGLVADMAWRAALLNPHLGADAPAKVEGLVVIDEVDLHLHPRWQRQVLHDLQKTFPHVQFVVTTHSPQVLGSARREWVLGLSPGASRPERGAWVEGRDSNAILDDLMGAESRDPEAAHQLERLFELIDDDDHERAASLLQELRAKLGPEDTAIVQAEARMHQS